MTNQAVSIQKFPVESIALLAELADLRILLEDQVDNRVFALAWDLTRCAILDNLIRAQNCDVVSDAVDLLGNQVTRDIDDPQTVLCYYGEGHMSGTFVTAENIDQIFNEDMKPASFASEAMKALYMRIEDARRGGGDIHYIGKIIARFHDDHARGDLDFGVIGPMVAIEGENKTVDIPLMYIGDDGHLYEMGGKRPGTGQNNFVGGFQEEAAVKAVVKEFLGEAVGLNFDGDRLASFFRRGVLSINVSSMTADEQSVYSEISSQYGEDANMVFIGTLFREAMCLDPQHMPVEKLSVFNRLMSEHELYENDKPTGGLTPTGKQLYFDECEPELKEALLRKLEGKGKLFEGDFLNQDRGSASAWKSGQFNCQIFSQDEFDQLLEGFPYLSFQADDDIEDLDKRRLVEPNLNDNSFDSHAFIRMLNCAGIVVHRLKQCADLNLEQGESVLSDALNQQLRDMVAHYEGREVELSPEMKVVYEDAISKMYQITGVEYNFALSTDFNLYL